MHLLHAGWITVTRFSTACRRIRLKKLQRVQNCAARLVVSARRHDHITPVLRDQIFTFYVQRL